jgi:alpha-galactosidase
MQDKYDYMAYRQDLPGFGEPMPGHWDGFQRINTDLKSGGIIGIFRHNSAENERLITLQYLDPEKNYTVSTAIEGEIVTSASGKQLMENGFKVRLNEAFDGALFEVAETER